jgi:hypothetical protein
MRRKSRLRRCRGSGGITNAQEERCGINKLGFAQGQARGRGGGWSNCTVVVVEDGGGLCGFCDTACEEGLEAVLRLIAKTRLELDTRL